jgi:hypothetical protein
MGTGRLCFSHDARKARSLCVSRNRGIKYRYYLSAALTQDRRQPSCSWQKTPSTRRREILLTNAVSSEGQHARPIRSETRATLVASIARGRRWLDEFSSDPSANAETMAARESCSIRKVNMIIPLVSRVPPTEESVRLRGRNTSDRLWS